MALTWVASVDDSDSISRKDPEQRLCRRPLDQRWSVSFQDIPQLFLVRRLTQGISEVNLSVMVGEMAYLVGGSHPCSSRAE